MFVIRLAREIEGLDGVLPAACYDLARYGPRRIVLGAEREQTNDDEDDSAEQHAHEKRDSYKKEDDGKSRMARLSRDELQMILTGRETAQRYLASFMSVSLCRRLPSPACSFTPDPSSAVPVPPPPTPHPCIESFYFIHLNLLRAISGIACGRDADPLFTLTQASEMLERKDFSDGERVRGLGICESCKAEFRDCVRRAREDVWRLIPGWFGLDSGKRTRMATATGKTTESESKENDMKREIQREVESV